MTLLKGLFERKSWVERNAVLFTLYIHMPNLFNCKNIRDAHSLKLEGTFKVLFSRFFFSQIRKQWPDKRNSLFT